MGESNTLEAENPRHGAISESACKVCKVAVDQPR